MQLVVTAVVTWFIVDQAGLTASALGQLDISAWEPSWWLFGLSSVVLILGYFANAVLWGLIVHGLGGPKLSTVTSIRVFMVANLGRYVPGKVWQIAGLVALARARGVRGSTATAAAVLGQGIGLAGATLLGLTSLWTVAEEPLWRWGLPVALLGGIALVLAPPVFHGLVSLWFRLAKTDQPEDLGPEKAAIWLVLGLGTWIIYGGAFWILVESMGFDMSPVSAASTFAAAYVLGYVMVFAPAGIGVREGFLVALMAPRLGPAVAGGVAVIARLWTTVMEVVPAAVFWARHMTRSHAPPKSNE